MRHGNKDMSKNIFKAMKDGAETLEAPVADDHGVGSVNIPESIAPDFSAMGNHNLGAAASMRMRGRPAPSVDSVTSEPDSIKEKVFIKKKIDFNLFENHILESIKNSAGRDNYYETLSSLYSLFLDGGLDRYSIEGLNKDTLLEIWDEFRNSLEESLD